MHRPRTSKTGTGDCTVTKCCTKACNPEHIDTTLTDNAFIIPLKERMVDESSDPLTRLFRMFQAKQLSRCR